MTRSRFLIFGLALLVAAAGATLASKHPDTLESFLGEQGIEGESINEAPLADYTVEGVESEGWSGFLAGGAGVLATFGFLSLLMALSRRATSPAEIASHRSDSGPPSEVDQSAS